MKISPAAIDSTFSDNPSTIEKLEARGLPIEMIEHIEKRFSDIYDKTFYEKQTQILFKNEGYSIKKEINCILRGQAVNNPDEFIKLMCPSDFTSLEYAPLISCDVERVFLSTRS